MHEVNGKNVLITGANRGIGLALAERFLVEGATCILTTRDASKRESLASALGNPQRATIEVADIADPSSVSELRDRVRARFPRIDVLINNAAIFLSGDMETHADTLDPRIMRETLEVNLFGTIAMCAAFAPLIPAGGRIINVSSTMGQLNDGITPYATAYSVSKTALNAYTSSLAAALSGRKIMVDTFHPGWVKTEMGGPNAQIEPHEATQTAVFLATRAPSDTTGRFWFESKPIAW
jgi:NAD(P)-dependent dehydrogenase (short-subunit alcohol dehydrogenase family)